MILTGRGKFFKADLAVKFNLPVRMNEEQVSGLEAFLSIHCLEAVRVLGAATIDPYWPGKRSVNLKRELRFDDLKATIEVSGTVPKRAPVDLVNDHLQAIIGAVQKIELSKSDSTAYLTIRLP
ncbi:MAG TPA: hypothetical protein VFZ48_05270 [Candidatus Saccharimonadales bacterium]